MLLLGLAGCSVTDPIPSVRHDGRYAGTRQSDRTEACGISRLQGTTSASVTGGRISMPLFNPRTLITGTVGENGHVRASGLWPNPTGGFAGMTVFNGQISDDVLEGTATDFRCHTNVHLQRATPLREHGGKMPRPLHGRP